MLEIMFTGPALSGKTSRLIETAQWLNQPCDYFQLATKPKEDGILFTQSGMPFYGRMVRSLSEIETNAKVILVDDVQFVHRKSIAPFLKKFRSRIILAAGVSFLHHECMSTREFSKYARTIEKIPVKCSFCSNPAKYSHKINAVSYVPICTLCLMEVTGIKPSDFHRKEVSFP